LEKLGDLLGRDMSCFLDTTIQGLPCAAPRSIDKNRPMVVRIQNNVYHGGGLLPISVENPYIMAHCIFSPTGWVRRHLKGSEVCRIKGILKNMIDTFSSRQISDVYQDRDLIPHKVVERILDTISPLLMTQDLNPGDVKDYAATGKRGKVIEGPVALDKEKRKYQLQMHLTGI
jgi:hypothetical protein